MGWKVQSAVLKDLLLKQCNLHIKLLIININIIIIVNSRNGNVVLAAVEKKEIVLSEMEQENWRIRAKK